MSDSAAFVVVWWILELFWNNHFQCYVPASERLNMYGDKGVCLSTSLAWLQCKKPAYQKSIRKPHLNEGQKARQ